ncbi:MAG: hypothetical protein WCJ66_11415 [Verrucomicrobiota bacterium]
MLSFLARFGRAKVGQISQSITEAIVRFDPETASEAQIAEFEAQLNVLTTKVATLRREYDNEQKEADAAQANYNRYMAAAEKLQNQIADPAIPSEKKASLEPSLSNLLTTIEGLVPEMEREIREAKEAKTFLAEFEQAAIEAAQKVTTARAKLTEAAHRMASAKLQRERATEMAEHAAVLAGIRSGNDSLGTALSAMEKVAQKDQDATTAATLKANLLTKHVPQSIENDQNVRDALGEASTSPSSVSLTDRLAALKARKG